SQCPTNDASVVLLGSRYVPPSMLEIRPAHSICASRFPFASRLCHFRLRLPVAGSRISMTAYQLPVPRSRMCPFILSAPAQLAFPLSSQLTPPRDLACTYPPPFPARSRLSPCRRLRQLASSGRAR